MPSQAISRARFREKLGDFLNRLGFPGAIRSTELHDKATGLTLNVRVSAGYTRINVNGRDYFFDRITGRYDANRTGNY